MHFSKFFFQVNAMENEDIDGEQLSAPLPIDVTTAIGNSAENDEVLLGVRL